MEKLKIQFKKLNLCAKLPEYGSEFAAGMDLYSRFCPGPPRIRSRRGSWYAVGAPNPPLRYTNNL